MDRLIGILRTPAHLVALVSRRTAVPKIGPDFLEQYWVDDTEAGLYEVVELPLGPETAQLVPEQERLLASWNALAAVQFPDDQALSHVLYICGVTESGYSSELTLPPLAFSETKLEPAYQPTAAHPRAFRGTKYKPPKPAQPPTIDLRPYLCNNESAVHTAFQPCAGALTPELERLRVDAARIQDLELPDTFRRMLHPLLRRADDAPLGEYLALYWKLGLDQRPGLFAAVVRLLSFQNNRITPGWLEVAARQPFEFQARFIHMLLLTDTYSRDVYSLTPADNECIDALTGSPFYSFRLYCLLSALEEQSDTSYLAAGFRLADSCKPDYRFDEKPYKGDFPEAAVGRLMAHLRGREGFYEQICLTIWECCGKLEGLAEILTAIDWHRYSQDDANEYLQLYLSFAYLNDTTIEAALKWDFSRRNFTRIEELLQSISAPYQPKCFSQLSDYFWYWSGKDPLAIKIERAIFLLRRLAGPPFKTRTHTGRLLSELIETLSLKHWDQFIQAPDSSFLRLEDACKSENSVALVGCGLAPMAAGLPGATVGCFTHSAARLCKVAKLLGSQSREMCAQTVRRWSALPLMDESLTEMPTADLCVFLTEQLGAVANAVIPRKLREHLTGERPLSATPLAHYRLQLEKNLCTARLDRMEADVLASLSEGFQVYAEQEPVRHALQMVRGIEDNRRALRKFLKAYFTGDIGYLLNHPLTNEWLKKHPGIPMEIWLKGIPYTRQTEQWGVIRIELETDSLEVLKLGAYVGSCLALGGLCDYSAAAALLDINKQVLYARDSKGRVLARQLVAISEEEEMVCFTVYPESVDPGLLQMFHEYDALFASALGLNPHTGKGSRDYTVECVLSENWWDDGAWFYAVRK